MIILHFGGTNNIFADCRDSVIYNFFEKANIRSLYYLMIIAFHSFIQILEREPNLII